MRKSTFSRRMLPSLMLTAIAGLALSAAPTLAAPVKHAKPHMAGHPAGVRELPPGTQRPTREVYLSLGQGELVTLPTAVANVWTSNPGAADVYVSSPRQIHIFGKAFGAATVFATTASGEVVYAANISVSQNVNSIDATLKSAMPDADIHVTLTGQVAVINGTVATPNDSAEAESLIKRLLNPGQKTSGDEPVKVMVINRLRTATPLQVNLMVRIAEVSRSLTRAIGTNIQGFTQQGNTLFGITRGGNPGTITPVNTATQSVTTGLPIGAATYSFPGNLANSTNLGLAGKFLGLDLLSSLDLGEQVGLVTTLAQPNLTAVSGETADFLAGGEFPIPLSQGLGQTTVEYKKFGVSLSYTPTVLANGNISIHVRPEVSELSSQGAVTLNGFTIPALTVRRAETTVELGSGQSFMIAGLLSNNANHTIEKLPGAGDLPVLGALFKSTNFQRGESELVIVVTPYLVRPVNAADIKLPTDGYQNPDEISQVLGNKLSGNSVGVGRPQPTAAPAGTAPPVPEKSAAAVSASPQTASAATAPGFNLK